MNQKVMGVLAVFVLLIGFLVAAGLFFSKTLAPPPPIDPSNTKVVQRSLRPQQEVQSTASSIQDELNNLSAQIVADVEAERRINLNMVGQLRAYQKMLGQIQEYAKEVEKQIDIIEDISQDEFQEDVKLQASLFSGKKADLVAKHLEAFRASRVGAILAKMKEKEASTVLDIWAKQKDPRVAAFYRETMAAYLNNKRRDLHPELFARLKGKEEATSASR